MDTFTGLPERQNFSQHPLLWLSLSLSLGIFLESYLDLGFWLWFFSCLLSIVILVFLISARYASPILIIAFLFAGAALHNAEKSSISENRLRKLYDEEIFRSGDPIEIEGTLVRREKAFDGVFIGLETKKAIYKQQEYEVSGFVRLFLPLRTEETIQDYHNLALDYGTQIKVFCNLKREDGFKTPGVTPLKKILDNKGIDAIATIKSPLLIEKGDEKTWNPLFAVFEAREWMIEKFLAIFSVRTSGIMIASLLGNDNFLEKDIERVFLEGGTFHLLVISGLQVTFIGGLVILILRLFTRNRIILFILPTLFVWSYALAVGIQEKPVVRASLMLTVVLLGKLIYRETSLLNLLSSSILILLIWKPSDLFDPSFQLTSLCVMAIAATSIPLLEKLKKIGQWKPSEETPAPPNCSNFIRSFCESLYWSEERWQAEQAQNIWSCNLIKTKIAEKLEKIHLQRTLRFFFEVFVVSTIVQIWLLSLSVFYFNRVSIVGLLLNLWAGIIMSVESLTAIISVLLYQISHALAMPLVLLTEALNQVMLSTTDWFVKRDLAFMRLPHYSGWMSVIYFIYLIPLVLISYLIHTWNPFENPTKREKSLNPLQILDKRYLTAASFACFIALTLVIIFPFTKPQADNLLHVEFLDVGQGDSIFIKTPTGETFLVDAGGRPSTKRIEIDGEIIELKNQNIGERVVSRFLWQKGYSEIDFLVSTHADIDHIQGLVEVARNFRIKAAFFGRMEFNKDEFSQLYETLRKQNTQIHLLSRGDMLNLGETKVLVLHPEETAENTEKKPSYDNNHSMVLRISYKNVSFLLTGDIEKEAETELLRFPELLSADVVKVPHHGSKTSSTEAFVKATKAKYAVISAGRDSPFEHPDEDVISRWKKNGARVLTTGDNGTIQFISDGKSLQLKTFEETVFFR